MECGFDRALAAWFAHCKSGQLWEGLLPSRGIIRPAFTGKRLSLKKQSKVRYELKTPSDPIP